MYLVGRVAGRAGHCFLFEVNIGRILLVQAGILAKHPAPVTAGAGHIHARTFSEDVLGEEAAAHIIRAADVALAATGMTLGAVFLPGGDDFFLDGLHRAHTLKKGAVKCGQGVVQVLRRRGGDLIMALSASVCGIREGRVFYDALMGRLPVRVLRISAMTGFTSQAAVFGVQECRGNVNFFVGLQRSQRAASPFTLCFRRFGRFPLYFLDFPSQPNETLDVGVASDAFAVHKGIVGGLVD